MDMETIGFFLYMEEQEEKEIAELREREVESAADHDKPLHVPRFPQDLGGTS